MKDDSFVDFVIDQLSTLGEVRARRMFGGHGLYRDRLFFAIVYDGRVYFKTDAETASRYKAEGMKPFRPRPGQELGRYYEVPVDVIEDDTLLAERAREAVRVAEEKALAPRKKGRLTRRRTAGRG